jgi:DNA-binding NtrC family response regulator
VFSDEGAGSTFELIFKQDVRADSAADLTQGGVQNLPSEQALPSEAKSSAEVFADSSPSVLLVDDCVDYVQSLGRALKAKGYKVFEAVGISDAIAIGNFHSPEIVISDWNMPDGGGRRLVEFFATRPMLPSILLLSGNPECHEIQRCVEDGVADFLMKPVDVENLCVWIAARSTVKREAA